jgi:ascorbate-specific PTS system EIIC-type component UlaA
MMMQIFKDINWIAVLVGAIGYFMLGALWYSFLFQKKWIAYNKIDVNDPNGKKGVGIVMFGSFIMMFICSAAIAVLAYRVGMWGWMSGVKLGLLTGLGFAFTSMAINMLYEKKPLGLYFINGGYQLLGNIIAAVVIVCWR